MKLLLITTIKLNKVFAHHQSFIDHVEYLEKALTLYGMKTKMQKRLISFITDNTNSSRGDIRVEWKARDYL